MGLKALTAGLLLALLIVLLPACTSASGVKEEGNLGAPGGTGFMTKTLAAGDHTRQYSLFVPHAYSPDRRWPVIVFLHGIGEAGSDAQANLTVGLGPEVAKRARDFPFIVIFAQSTGGWDADSKAAADVVATLEQVKKDYSVDADRVVLTGLSTGGYGTWAIGAKYRPEFSALVPMCGYSAKESMIPELAKIPVWAFHNSGDPFVLANSSNWSCNQINKAGGHAKYTEFGALGHDCWKAAYSDPELFSWMLAQRRTNVTGQAAAPAVTPSPVRANQGAAVPSPY
ncbi:MAG: dienelactone hydrolase family protein [Phycisphaerae bacterium]